MVQGDGYSYAAAGVDIESAERSLRAVTDAVQATHGPQVIGGIGGFGGLFAASFPGIEGPVLVSSIDGVGTKTKVAQMAGDYSGIGADIVNHCVNDILCQGARPLFFLDYFGCSRLEPTAFEEVVSGAARACSDVECALIGGETAEMPGVYVEGEVDVVGAIVGVVGMEARLPRGRIAPGDRLIGLASNGLHTNGYSLARKALLEVGGLSVRDPLPTDPTVTVGEALLKPHTCYFHAVYPLLQRFAGIKALAHITGGGIYGNLPRALRVDVQAKVLRSNWEPLPVFRAIQECGNIPDADMFTAFNMGIGMVMVVEAEISDEVARLIGEQGIYAAEIGKLQPGARDVQIV